MTHPFDTQSVLFLTFDLVYILKSICNYWLNEKDIEKSFQHPDFANFAVDYCQYPLEVHSHASKMHVTFIVRRV